MSDIIQSRMKAIRKQAETLQRAARTPMGVFETFDEIIRNSRKANQETLNRLTGGKVFAGQLGGLGTRGRITSELERLKRRLRLPY